MSDVPGDDHESMREGQCGQQGVGMILDRAILRPPRCQFRKHRGHSQAVVQLKSLVLS